MNSISVDTPMDLNAKLLPSQGEPLLDPEKYRRLVRKLNYPIVICPDISFVVSVVSQFLNSPCVDQWNTVIHIMKYIKGSLGKDLLYGHNNYSKVVCYSDADWAGSPSDKRSTSRYCVLIVDNLIYWKSKKQHVVTRSSAKAKYRTMVSTTCELIWLKHILKELQFGKTTYVIIRLLFILARIISLMKGPNILRSIVISFEKKLYVET